MEREELLQLYKKEKDPNVKDRLMLNIRVRFENHGITEAARFLGKVTSWGSKWYRRFAKAGLEGLQNLPRPGRPTRITGEETAGIRKEMDGRQYWTVGGARELISKVTGVTYSVSSVYKMLRRWGYFLRVPVKRHVRRPPDEEIARFQKELAETDTEEDRGGLHGGRAGRDNRYRRRPAQEGLTPGREGAPSAPLPARTGRRWSTACRPWTAGACACSTTGSPRRTLQTF